MKTFGWTLFIVSEIIGFIFSISLVGQVLGTTGVILGIFLFPIVLVVVPLYSLIVLGDWLIIFVVYGMGLFSRFLITYDKSQSIKSFQPKNLEKKADIIYEDDGVITRGFDYDKENKFCRAKNKKVQITEMYREVGISCHTLYSCSESDRPFLGSSRETYACIRCEFCPREEKCACYNCEAAAGKKKLWE